jgi:hypothetical protein
MKHAYRLCGQNEEFCMFKHVLNTFRPSVVLFSPDTSSFSTQKFPSGDVFFLSKFVEMSRAFDYYFLKDFA